MTTQQRDADFAHVRVGTVVGFLSPVTGDGLRPDRGYEVIQIESAAYATFDIVNDEGAELLVPKDLWIAWRGYIISQPDEAAEAEHETLLQNFFDIDAGEDYEANITKGELRSLLESAARTARDKALEDAARVCEDLREFSPVGMSASHQRIQELAASDCGDAIRQMKGSGV